jgi:hypothetical protein
VLREALHDTLDQVAVRIDERQPFAALDVREY